MKVRLPFLLVLVAVAGAAVWLWRPWAPAMHPWLGGQFFLGEAVAGLRADLPKNVELDVLVSDLRKPWDLVFVDDSTMLVTEKGGTIWRIDLNTRKSARLGGVPPVKEHGQGGLHRVILHPQFEENRWIYFSYAQDVEGKGVATHFVRATLDGNRLVDAGTILIANTDSSRGQHFGGGMVFDNQGYLFLAVGDRGQRDLSQDLSNHNGKILRVHDDGRVPEDNPFVDTAGALPEIYSYGHRNPQGMSLDKASGRIWAAEHGPRGGDEINWIRPGINYGWPIITYGKEYSGFKLGDGISEKEGMEQPVHHYVPSIATCGLAFYDGDMFPEWKNSLLVAGLRGMLSQVKLDESGIKASGEKRYLRDAGLRIRAVRQHPDGSLFVTSDNGVVIRLFRKS